MKLQFDNKGKVNSRESVTEKDVIDMVEMLHPLDLPYLILEDTSGDYIQCMAGDIGFVVETRLHDNPHTFKHFVIGKKDVNTTWYSINGTVGPVNVLGSEVLQVGDVKNLFISFFFKRDVQQSYKKRDTTKLFR